MATIIVQFGNYGLTRINKNNKNNKNNNNKRKNNTGPRRRRVRSSNDMYVRSAPMSLGVTSGPMGTSLPKITSTRNGMIVTHRERVKNVTAAGSAFEAHSYVVNPGMAGTFPWLSSLANLYEKYKFRKLKIHYMPCCASTQIGQLCFAADWDVNDIDPDSMEEMGAWQDHMTTNCWAPCSVDLFPTLNDRKPEHFTRPGTPYSLDFDLTNYDTCKLWVATTGVGAAVIGSFEIEYTIELFVHQLEHTESGSLYGPGTRTDAKPFGDAALVSLGHRTVYPPVSHDTSTGDFVFDSDWEGLLQVVVKGTPNTTAPTAITRTGSLTPVSSNFTTLYTVLAGSVMIMNLVLQATQGSTLRFAIGGTGLALNIAAIVQWFQAEKDVIVT